MFDIFDSPKDLTSTLPLSFSSVFCRQVKEYDTISRLDQWLTTMLLRIKKTIQDEENDLC